MFVQVTAKTVRGVFWDTLYCIKGSSTGFSIKGSFNFLLLWHKNFCLYRHHRPVFTAYFCVRRMTAGKRKRLSKKLEMRPFLQVNQNCYMHNLVLSVIRSKLQRQWTCSVAKILVTCGVLVRCQFKFSILFSIKFIDIENNHNCNWTRSSANAEEPCEHTVSWNRVKCCINVRYIAFEEACNQRITFKVIQGHCRCCHLIGHILYPISLPL